MVQVDVTMAALQSPSGSQICPNSSVPGDREEKPPPSSPSDSFPHFSLGISEVLFCCCPETSLALAAPLKGAWWGSAGWRLWI